MTTRFTTTLGCIYFLLILCATVSFAAEPSRLDIINSALDSYENESINDSIAEANAAYEALVQFNASVAKPSTHDYSTYDTSSYEYPSYQDWESPLEENVEATYSQPDLPNGEDTHVSGHVRMGIGFDTDDTFLKRANYDLNELNFRTLSTNALDNRENTYDPGVYSQIKLDVDYQSDESPVSAHTNIAIDPWSFVGKSKTVTVEGAGGDRLDVEYFYWGNSDYTVNRVLHTLDNGDRLALPEFRVKDGKVAAQNLTSSFGNTFAVPELDIDQTFQPFRELWFDVHPSDRFHMRIFPFAYEDMALTSDDPLRLSNNKIYWEESPWLASWQPGNLNSGAGDFTQGRWDDSLAFFTRDSDGRRLTSLRGINIHMKPLEKSDIQVTVATPKHLWQEYSSVDSLPMAARSKYRFNDKFQIGSTYAGHLGFHKDTVDAYDLVSSADTKFILKENIKVEAQTARSYFSQDRSNARFKNR